MGRQVRPVAFQGVVGRGEHPGSRLVGLIGAGDRWLLLYGFRAGAGVRAGLGPLPVHGGHLGI
jgi:hypothetical protein